jgi:hypothetical protein
MTRWILLSLCLLWLTSEISVRAEYYQQTYNVRVPVPPGLQGLDLYPGLKAILVQVGWRF